MVTLLTVRDAVKQAGEISLGQLAQQLTVEPRWLTTLLDELIQRGKIRRCEITAACQQTCQGCDAKPNEVIYRWVGADLAVQIL